jgi:hypothetical protein
MAAVTGPGEAWIDKVLSASDTRRRDVDWVEWFHEVFRELGPVGAAELARAALAEQRQRATKACALVVADVSATTSRVLGVVAFLDEFDAGQFVVRLRLDDTLVNGSGLYSIGIEELTVEVADALQEQVMDDSDVWPVCLDHNAGLHPQLDGGQAAWVCRVGDHRVALIGHLGDMRPVARGAAKRRERRKHQA